jgi:organic hydroperoxide reductase OsmC/OhrA
VHPFSIALIGGGNRDNCNPFHFVAVGTFGQNLRDQRRCARHAACAWLGAVIGEKGLAMDEARVELELLDGYRFVVDFDDPALPSLVVDEPPPLGEGTGPNAARLLAAAVANCLSASALFCFRKARVEVTGMRTTATARIDRNADGRARIVGIDVVLHPEVAPEQLPRMGRCLELFEDYCVVTQSVRGGVAVDVTVEPEAAPALTAG